MKIDAHHHFWKYTPEDYGWMSDEMSKIRRDFLPADLKSEIDAVGIDGVVSVQARQITAETTALLGYAAENPFIKAVVGWVPLISPQVRRDLEKFAPNKKLKGVRHVLHDESDDRYMLRKDFNEGIAALKEFNLVYDILIFEKHLPQTLQFVDRHPDQIFVLDHIAKPRIKDGYLSPWQSNIVQLAHRPNIYCKISGMVTEANWTAWTEKELRPYFDTVISAFGPKRLMFGSDWPVCLVAAEYKRWFEVVNRAIADLTPSEKARILGETAAEAYNLNP